MLCFLKGFVISMGKTIKLQELNKQYNFVCNEWVQKFCNKQQLDFDGWVGDEIGGIASFSCQYFFNLSDIILDLNTKQPKGLILDWQSDAVDFNMFNPSPQNINYKSYTMGLRFDNLEKKDVPECEHPYAFIIGDGEMSPAKCLKCGKVLSE